MADLVRQFAQYLQETLGIITSPTPWNSQEQLPFFLLDNYGFYDLRILNSTILLMVDQSESEQTPATIRKHLSQVRERTRRHVLYLHEGISSYNRRRLIEQKVPFVVPGNQLYLPDLGIDLREHMKKLRAKESKLRPSAQAVVIYALVHGADTTYTPSELADRLGYADMTLSRAFDEIESNDLAETSDEGRKRILRFAGHPSALWERAEPFMRSPVKKQVWIEPPRGSWSGLKAGITALAHHSHLMQPQQPTYALGMKDWKWMREHHGIEELPKTEPAALELEIWSYSPHLFANEELVDPFSLYLSLQDEPDDRVQAALREMMEEALW